MPNNRLIFIPKEQSKSFIEDLNKSIPSEEFMESCKKAGRLFNQPSNDKNTDSEDK